MFSSAPLRLRCHRWRGAACPTTAGTSSSYTPRRPTATLAPTRAQKPCFPAPIHLRRYVCVIDIDLVLGLVSKLSNIKLSIYRNIKISRYRDTTFDISKCQSFDMSYRTGLALHPLASPCFRCWRWTKASMYQISKQYRVVYSVCPSVCPYRIELDYHTYMIPHTRYDTALIPLWSGI